MASNGKCLTIRNTGLSQMHGNNFLLNLLTIQNKFILQKLMDAQLDQKIPAAHGTGRSIKEITKKNEIGHYHEPVESSQLAQNWLSNK
jgi:hypothetical protein